ncbi:MAG: hypothetical protein L6Q46_04800 [Flavobacterium sp.]|uniref:hypothetical protein n=1 Tax=Flavobacterium sp. TaxID=239 RepID=UPI0025BD4B02|nr:hypothetical protein [Flavobacterium sp.]MCK6607609.1 hypothetical protein [Flavobacterium sp.]
MRYLSILFFCFLLFITACSKIDNTQVESFNKYDKVRLLSYDSHRKVYSKEDYLWIKNDTLIIPKVKIIDNVILSKEYKKQIINVLCSYDNKNCSMADCYNPRHILLFYRNNKVVDYYEFCASCGGSTQSRGMKIPSICTEQGQELIKIFKKMKLKNDGEEGFEYKYF